jgi:hypothetical protein
MTSQTRFCSRGVKVMRARGMEKSFRGKCEEMATEMVVVVDAERLFS